MMSRPPSQANNNTLIDLFVRIKDLLKEGRTDVVYTVAKRSEMHPNLQSCFADLADLIIGKNEEIEERAMINRFYREFITKIKEKQPVTEEMLRNQYSFIGADVQDMLLELVLYVNSLENQAKIAEEECQQMRKERQQIEMRLLSQKSELQSFVDQIKKVHEQEKMEQEKEKRGLLEALNQLKDSSEKEIKQSQIMIELKSQENSTLQKNFQDKQVQCEAYINQIQNLSQKLLSLQRQLNEKVDISISQSNMSQELSMRLKEKQEQNEALKSRIEGNQVNHKIAASSKLLAESSIFLEASNIKYELPYNLLSTLESLNGEISSIEKLYTFSFQKKASFHQFIDNRQNILIICSTIDDKILGAFTTAKFSLLEKLDTKAFLFGMFRDQISINYLKPGRASINYDVDFLIFGNQQLCIERGSDELTSFYPHAPQSSRYYKSSSREDHFLEILGDNGKVILKNYEIFQINFKQ